jgi:predicted amidohydrolase YtcJ
MAIDPLQETVVVGARIHTRCGEEPVEALLVRAGRIAAAGGVDVVRALAGRGATTLDLGGGWVTPGLTDAHIHMTAWALARRRIALQGTASAADAAMRVYESAPAGDGWVLGQGWQANAWAEPPARAALDAHFPTRPVALESQDLHALWVNGEALRRAGVTRDTPDPAGGRIEKDRHSGEPTGVLLENACALIMAHVPPPAPAAVQEALDEAQSALHAWGITGIHSVEPSGLADFQRMRQRDALRMRVLQTIPLDAAEAALALRLRSGHGGSWLRTGGVKMFLDGALGSRTAWLREPYQGEAGYRGISTLPPGEFAATVARLVEGGIAATVHAIGDAAVELALDVLGAHPAADLAVPHRIEHLQLCPPELWERAAGSGIVASMQPIHLMTDIGAAERHWGTARSRGAYAFAPLLRGGMTLALG